MHSPPPVSVLMPTYNDGRYLHDAVDSILTQTFHEFEFIIVNDGSTDNTEKILSGYVDPRIRVICHENNLGRPKARNTALNAATGKYIAWMDADDISMPRRLEKQVAFMDNNPHIAVCSGAIQRFGLSDAFSRPPARDDVIRKQLFWGASILNPASCIRRSAVLEHGIQYDPCLSRAQDYDFWCSMLLDHKLSAANLPDLLLLYRITKQNFYPEAHKEILRKNLNRLKIEPSPENISIYFSFACETAEEFLSGHTFSAAVNWLSMVERSNATLGVFPHKLLSMDLRDKLWSLCKLQYGNRIIGLVRSAGDLGFRYVAAVSLRKICRVCAKIFATIAKNSSCQN